MIYYYTEVIAEIDIVEKRLAILKDEKEELYQKLVGVKSPSTNNEGGTHGGNSNNKVIAFMHLTEEVEQASGLTLVEEINHYEAKLKKLNEYKRTIENALESEKSIEYELIKEITINKLKRTKAVEVVAERHHYASVNSIWENHYARIKPTLKLLEKKKR